MASTFAQFPVLLPTLFVPNATSSGGTPLRPTDDTGIKAGEALNLEGGDDFLNPKTISQISTTFANSIQPIVSDNPSTLLLGTSDPLGKNPRAIDVLNNTASNINKLNSIFFTGSFPVSIPIFSNSFNISNPSSFGGTIGTPGIFGPSSLFPTSGPLVNNGGIPINATTGLPSPSAPIGINLNPVTGLPISSVSTGIPTNTPTGVLPPSSVIGVNRDPLTGLPVSTLSTGNPVNSVTTISPTPLPLETVVDPTPGGSSPLPVLTPIPTTSVSGLTPLSTPTPAIANGTPVAVIPTNSPLNYPNPFGLLEKPFGAFPDALSFLIGTFQFLAAIAPNVSFGNTPIPVVLLPPHATQPTTLPNTNVNLPLVVTGVNPLSPTLGNSVITNIPTMAVGVPNATASPSAATVTTATNPLPLNLGPVSNTQSDSSSEVSPSFLSDRPLPIEALFSQPLPVGGETFPI